MSMYESLGGNASEEPSFDEAALLARAEALEGHADRVDGMVDTGLIPTEYAVGATFPVSYDTDSFIGRGSNQLPDFQDVEYYEIIMPDGATTWVPSGSTSKPNQDICEVRPAISNEAASQGGDASYRMMIVGVSVRTGGNNMTADKPDRVYTGLPIRYRKFPKPNAETSGPLALGEHPLEPGTQLTIKMNDAVLVGVGPGEEGAIATDGISTCSGAAGIALFTDGSRVAYTSHYGAETDDNYRAEGIDGEQPLTARMMQQFAEAATARGGLEKIIIAAMHVKGLEQYAAGRRQEDGTFEMQGARIVTAIAQTAAQLREQHVADVAVVPYLLPLEGVHSIGAHMGVDRNVIYVDNEPVAEF